MKLKTILLNLISLQWINAQQKSEITDVTVYLDGAEISRLASITLNSGNSDNNEDKGILKWILNLKPGTSECVKHSFSVKYPKGKRVNL